jgi:hypothetical protein
VLSSNLSTGTSTATGESTADNDATVDATGTGITGAVDAAKVDELQHQCSSNEDASHGTCNFKHDVVLFTL